MLCSIWYLLNFLRQTRPRMETLVVGLLPRGPEDGTDSAVRTVRAVGTKATAAREFCSDCSILRRLQRFALHPVHVYTSQEFRDSPQRVQTTACAPQHNANAHHFQAVIFARDYPTNY